MLAPNLPASTASGATRLVREVLPSAQLDREVELSLLLPPPGLGTEPYPVLYLNDGQDLPRLGLQATLDELYAQELLQPFLLVAIHANEERVQEYGTAGHPDFNGRGSKADAYTRFLLEELLPFVQASYGATADPAGAVLAGFSLGGLSAFDIAWHHPEAFARAGVFSGSFWWRQRALGPDYTPADRIMHRLVRARCPHPNHRFWLQTGTLDETTDRNENGVIDSIEDTLDLIDALVAQGLDAQYALRYVQVQGGRHRPHTWGRVMPDFLQWAFGQPAQAAALPLPVPMVRLLLDPTLEPEPEEADSPDVHRAPAAVASPLETAPEAVDISKPEIPPAMPLARPAAGDFLPYAITYINQIPEGADPRETLRTIAPDFHAIFAGLNEAKTEQGYAPGKWSLKEMLVHQIDTERIFAYRAMRFARGDSQDLPGFDQDEYVANSGANARSLASLLAEYDATRAATIALFDSFTDEQLERRGTANGGPTTVRALLFIVPGHELHHLHVLRERYLPVL